MSANRSASRPRATACVSGCPRSLCGPAMVVVLLGLVAGAAAQPPGPGGSAPTAGGAGRGLMFYRDSDYAATGGLAGIDGATGLTVEAWFRNVGGYEDTAIFSYSTGNNLLAFALFNSGAWAMNAGATFDEMITAEADEWHHYALAIDLAGAVVDVYFDGELYESLDAPGNVDAAFEDGGVMLLGQVGDEIGTSFLSGVGAQGMFDEVRLWKAYRSGDAIREGMYYSVDSAATNLVSAWAFDRCDAAEGSDVRLFDCGPSANDFYVGQVLRDVQPERYLTGDAADPRPLLGPSQAPVVDADTSTVMTAEVGVALFLSLPGNVDSWADTNVTITSLPSPSGLLYTTVLAGDSDSSSSGSSSSSSVSASSSDDYYYDDDEDDEEELDQLITEAGTQLFPIGGNRVAFVATAEGDNVTFSYQLANRAGSSTGTVTLVPNSPPVAANVSFEIAEEEYSILDLTVSDPDGDWVSAELMSLPAAGRLYDYESEQALTQPAMLEDFGRQVIFLPDANSYGDDYATFRYRVWDAAGGVSDEAYVSVAVTEVDDRPLGEAGLYALWFDGSSSGVEASLPNATEVWSLQLWFSAALEEDYDEDDEDEDEASPPGLGGHGGDGDEDEEEDREPFCHVLSVSGLTLASNSTHAMLAAEGSDPVFVPAVGETQLTLKLSDAGFAEVFVNGDLAANASWSAPVPLPVTHVAIGAVANATDGFPHGEAFQFGPSCLIGFVDEVRLYGHSDEGEPVMDPPRSVFSASDVDAASVTHHWHFDEGIGLSAENGLFVKSAGVDMFPLWDVSAAKLNRVYLYEDESVDVFLPALDMEGRQGVALLGSVPTAGQLFQVDDGNATALGEQLTSSYKSWVREEPVELWAYDLVAVSSTSGTSAGACLVGADAEINPAYTGCQALGEPSTYDPVYPSYASSWLAWSPSYACDEDGEHLELVYEEAVFIQNVAIYENFGAGAVSAVKALKTDPDTLEQSWQALYEGDVTPGASREYTVFEPTLCEPSFKTDTIRIELDTCSGDPEYNEIDAVSISGTYSPVPGTVSSVSNRVRYFPQADFNGEDAFTYFVSDCLFNRFRMSPDSEVDIVVLPVNDAPVVGDEAFDLGKLDSHDPLVSLALQNIHDVDNDTLFLLITDFPDFGELYYLDEETGAETPVPASGWVPNDLWYEAHDVLCDFDTDSAADGFSYRASDGSLASAGTATVSLERLCSQDLGQDIVTAVGVLASIAEAAIICVWIAFTRLQWSNHVLLAQTESGLLHVVLLGAAFGPISAFVHVVPTTDKVCVAREFLLSLTFSLLFVGIAAQRFATSRRGEMSALGLACLVGLPVSVDLMVTSLRMLLDNVHEDKASDSCTGDHWGAWEAVGWVVRGVALCVVFRVASRWSRLPDDEAQSCLAAVHNAVMFIPVTVGAYSLLVNSGFERLLSSAVLLLGHAVVVASVVGLVFVAKLRKARRLRNQADGLHRQLQRDQRLRRLQISMDDESASFWRRSADRAALACVPMVIIGMCALTLYVLGTASIAHAFVAIVGQGVCVALLHQLSLAEAAWRALCARLTLQQDATLVALSEKDRRMERGRRKNSLLPRAANVVLATVSSPAMPRSRGSSNKVVASAQELLERQDKEQERQERQAKRKEASAGEDEGGASKVAARAATSGRSLGAVRKQLHRELKTGPVGAKYAVVQLVLTGAWACAWFISTYHLTHYDGGDAGNHWVVDSAGIPSGVQFINDVCVWAFVFDYCLWLFAADSKLRYLFSRRSLFDLLSLPPTWVLIDLIGSPLAEFSLNYPTIMVLYGFLRPYRLIEFVQRAKARSHSTEALMKYEVASLVLFVFLVVFSIAGVMMMLEAPYQSFSDTDGNPYTPKLHDFVYFSIVTISTVGYGDFNISRSESRVVLMFVIFYSISVIPVQVGKIVDLMRLPKRTIGDLPPKGSTSHVILYGTTNPTFLTRMLNELFHPDHNADDDLHVIVLAEDPVEDNPLETLITSHRFRGCTSYLCGSVLTSSDLAASSASTCKALFLLSPPFSDDVGTGDSRIQAYAQALTLRFPQLTKRCFVQLIEGSDHNKQTLHRVGLEHVVVLSEWKEMLTGLSVKNPGAATLLTNLITTDTPDIELRQRWQYEYCAGMENEIYQVAIPPCFAGRRFVNAVHVLYEECDVMLFALSIDGAIVLNPAEYTLREGVTYTGYAISADDTNAIECSYLTADEISEYDDAAAAPDLVPPSPAPELPEVVPVSEVAPGSEEEQDTGRTVTPAPMEPEDSSRIVGECNILLTGATDGLYHLMQSMHSFNASSPQSLSVTILSHEPPAGDILTREEVKWVQGSGTHAADLMKAGVDTADKVVVLSSPYGAEHAQQDSRALVIMSLLRSLRRNGVVSKQQAHIFEVVEAANLPDVDDEGGLSFLLSPAFAAGEVVLPLGLQSLLLQQFFEPSICAILSLLVHGPDASAQSADYVASVLGTRRMPSRLVGQTYSQLVRDSTRRGVVPLGLLRVVDGNRFVFTNPPHRVPILLGPEDMIFELAAPEK